MIKSFKKILEFNNNKVLNEFKKKWKIIELK